MDYNCDVTLKIEYQSAHSCARALYLGQITVVAGQTEVKVMRLVVGDDPREDGVLVEVVVRASRHRVEVHQVVEVGDLASLPLLHHARHLEELLRRRHRHASASVT